MNQRFEQQMKKGVLDMLVLGLLRKEEKYGYQMISELKEKSEGMLSLKEGTLYPILYRMEDEQLIYSKWSTPKGRDASRKYYAITENGRIAFEEMNTVWKNFGNTIDLILSETN